MTYASATHRAGLRALFLAVTMAAVLLLLPGCGASAATADGEIDLGDSGDRFILLGSAIRASSTARMIEDLVGENANHAAILAHELEIQRLSRESDRLFLEGRRADSDPPDPGPGPDPPPPS